MLNIFLIIIILVLISIIVILLKASMCMISMPFGAPFVVSEKGRLNSMIELAQIKRGEKVIDIGCGDGEIILNLAEMGILVEGIEINPILVRKCKKRIYKLGLQDLVKVKQGNFWVENFSEYDVIFLYGVPHVMEKLENKLLRELKPGSRVVSNYFQFPTWEAVATKNNVRIYYVQ